MSLGFALYNCFFATLLSLISLGVLADATGVARQSTYELMSPENRAMQDNAQANPGLFWVLDGKALWDQPEGPNKRSCASCHGQAEQSMKGVAAGFPKLRAKVLTTLEEQINHCRTTKQQSASLAHESKPLVALTTFVANQSKGIPIDLNSSPELMVQIDAGKKLFDTRMGQLNLSCANCHSERAGAKLAGNAIPQAHPTSYPQYRLEWQAVGTLERRLRNCMIGVRAQAYAYDSQELKQLEVFLAWRARGMLLETPGVRP